MFEIRLVRRSSYKRRHDEIWPELAEALWDAGLRNYTLFRRGRQVIAHVECLDVATAFGRGRGDGGDDRWSGWFEDVIEALTDEERNLM
jgi:L-rhamnose mutarotase